MDINIVYNKILDTLTVSENVKVLTDLKNVDAGAVTGTEALMATGFFLSGLKHNNPLVYELLKEQIIDYLKYCKQNGIIIA